MKRVVVLGALVSLSVLSAVVLAAAETDKEAVKQGLQELNDFIGSWKGSGSPDKPRPDPKDVWGEKIDWSWRFKGDDIMIRMDVENGKYLKQAEVRYLPAKKIYQVTVFTTDGKSRVFEGKFARDTLTVSRTDPDTKEFQQFKMNTAGDGVRFIYRYEHRPAGRTISVREFQVASTKEGESLASSPKKVECIVSGGLGTIPVSFNGVTYYVCCSGCKEAFNENPAKFVKEWEAKKGKK